MDGKSKTKKVLSIIGNVLLWLFLAFCLVMLIFAIVAKRSDDGAVNFFGNEMRVVLSPSMAKSDETDVSGFEIKDIPVRSLVITEVLPEDEEEAAAWYGELKVGDVLTFRYLAAGRQETITHRIIAIEKLSDGYKITLRGDNGAENAGEQVIYTDEATNPEPANYVLGKVVHVSVVLGNIIYILQQPIGIALVIIVPAAIVIIFQLLRIVTVLSGEKRKQAEEKQAEQEGEIEALKKRLAEMEQQQTENAPTMSEDTPSETPPDEQTDETPPGEQTDETPPDDSSASS